MADLITETLSPTQLGQSGPTGNSWATTATPEVGISRIVGAQFTFTNRELPRLKALTLNLKLNNNGASLIFTSIAAIENISPVKFFSTDVSTDYFVPPIPSGSVGGSTSGGHVVAGVTIPETWRTLHQLFYTSPPDLSLTQAFQLGESISNPGVGVSSYIDLDMVALGHRNRSTFTLPWLQTKWSGILALSIFISSATITTVESLTLTAVYAKAHTGALDMPLDRRARVVRDFKGGFPYLSDEAVSDGYLGGTKVHPVSWDPEDPGPTFIPPATEGAVDDEVPD